MIRVPVPPGFPAGAACDVVETSAEHGMRVLGCLAASGSVLVHGDRWSWIVPSGSDIGVAWPPQVRYRANAAVLAPAASVEPDGGYGPDLMGGQDLTGGPDLTAGPDGRRTAPGARRQPPVPYTHPILLYFAVCCVTGVRPTLTEH
jgi:hypothetical protein